MSVSTLSIGIVAPQPPPGGEGGAERLWRTLGEALQARGHEVEHVTIPFPERNFGEILDGYEAFSRLDVSRFDVVISGKYPAWMVEHPCHVLYLLHPLRGFYDLYLPHWSKEVSEPLAAALAAATSPAEVVEIGRRLIRDAEAGDPFDFPGPEVRAIVHRLDELALTPERIRRFAAISGTVAARPEYLPDDVAVLVAYPESSLAHELLARRPLPAPPNPEFFTVSRLDVPKRIDLLIDAFSRVEHPHARFLIAGDGPDRERLADLAAVDARVEVLGRISDDELAERYRSATAVLFAPDREDFGYITVEAMAAGTPVITTVDSGGAAELVDDGRTGITTAATPDALAAAMRDVICAPWWVWRASIDGRRAAASLGWRTLLEDVERLGGNTRRPRTVTLSTFATEPVVTGGQRRVRHLHRALARDADVTVLALTREPAGNDRVRRRVVEAGITEIVVPRSPAHLEAEHLLGRVVNSNIDDLVAGTLAPSTPAFQEELDRHLATADAVILSHPFLAHALPEHLDVPIVYDSHNYETGFKADAVPDTDGGHWLIEQVRSAEIRAAGEATLVTACTENDLDDLAALVREDQDRGLAATVVVPNGVDAATLAMRSAEHARLARTEILTRLGLPASDARPLAVFVASWHPPNLDAGRLIIATARRRRDWLFLLAGGHTNGLLHEGAATADGGLPHNVRLLAEFPEDWLWPLIAGSTAALNPMTWGGGSNLKLFDYLAVGTPVLTTPVGCRGLEHSDDVVWKIDPTLDGLSDGLDRIRAEAWTPEVDPSAAMHPTAGSRQQRGRELIDGTSPGTGYGWEDLGRRWAGAVLDALGVSGPGSSGATRAREAPDTTGSGPPELAPSPPPAGSTTVEVIADIGAWTRADPPPRQETAMDPALRRQLDEAEQYRHLNLPSEDASVMRFPKRLLGRIGFVMLGEQRRYNRAVLQALHQLTGAVDELRLTVEDLQRSQTGTAAANDPAEGDEPT